VVEVVGVGRAATAADEGGGEETEDADPKQYVLEGRAWDHVPISPAGLMYLLPSRSNVIVLDAADGHPTVGEGIASVSEFARLRRIVETVYWPSVPRDRRRTH
jgi:hypothetical protein